MTGTRHGWSAPLPRRDARALGDQGLGDREPDSPAGAGDDGDLPGYANIHGNSFARGRLAHRADERS
jgi:hypothetical protein